MVKTPVTEQWVQNRDYELIPGDNNFWKVRLLTGDFIETVYQYGEVKFDERQMTISFTYEVLYTPDQSVTADDPELQKIASNVLHSLMVGLLGEENGSGTNNHRERDQQ